MPRLKEGMKSVETSVPKNWQKKIDRIKKRRGTNTNREFFRNLIYERLVNEGEL